MIAPVLIGMGDSEKLKYCSDQGVREWRGKLSDHFLELR
jgi:hypothetical protein